MAKKMEFLKTETVKTVTATHKLLEISKKI